MRVRRDGMRAFRGAVLSMALARLRLQSAPPLVIPLSFFGTAPLSLAVAGAVVLLSGSEVFANRWTPLTLALTHLGTLGFVSMVMMGATYPLLTVVVGSGPPWPRSARVVHGLFTIGVAAFCWGVARGNPSLVFVAIAALTFSVALFLVPVGIALFRAPKADPTVFGIRAAVGFFFIAAVAGIWMAHGFSGMRFPGSRLLWSQAHLSVALVGWVGGLVAAVSWQMLPRLYLAPPVQDGWRWAVQILAAVGALGPTIVLALDYSGLLAVGEPAPEAIAAAVAAPGAIAVWLLHPAVAAWSLAKRAPGPAHASLRFWQAGLAGAPLTALSALAAWFLEAPHWDVLFGWLALWGWVGLIMHGMMTRIVPVLVWRHRFASQAGERDASSIDDLLPDAVVRRGLALHMGSLLVGVAAILTGLDPLARLAGVLLILTACSIGSGFVRALRHGPAS